MSTPASPVASADQSPPISDIIENTDKGAKEEDKETLQNVNEITEDKDTNIISTKLLINDEETSEIANKNEVQENNSTEVLEIIPLEDEVNITKKEDTYSEVTKILTYNETSEQMMAAQPPDTEQLKTAEDKLTVPVLIDKRMGRHNKPKKARDYMVTPQDYACTGVDWSVIETIKSEPHSKRYLVSIDNANLKRRHLLTLLKPGEFVGDEIIHAYIHCISAKEHLQVRPGKSVFLEDPCISKLIKTGSCLPIDYTDDAPEWVLRRVETYLEHDMIFIPVNVDDIHWYVAVINFRKRCIQVLDSLGPRMHRKDLISMLQGVENIFKYASLRMELKSAKWEDLNVTTWQREECIKSSLQTDGSSCGLWMLNFMEYFTGDELSDTPKQERMGEKLKALSNYWPNNREYHISECDKIFLPYHINGLFILFVLDQKKKFIYVLDPLSRPTWGIHIFKNMEIGNTINLALQLVNPKWNDDISKWGRKVPIVPTNSKGALTGYLVFNLIHSWYDEASSFQIHTDEDELRKRFLVHILKYQDNEAFNNIPVFERERIERIKRWNF
ncbi:unnamed protein product [Alopecurus aequalis]